MKIGLVSTRLLGSRKSLRASDYLCPRARLELVIAQLERRRERIDAELNRARAKLFEGERLERFDIAREDLVLLTPGRK